MIKTNDGQVHTETRRRGREGREGKWVGGDKEEREGVGLDLATGQPLKCGCCIQVDG
jgi:hypothetical protein